MLYLSNDRGNMDGYAVNTKILIVFKGDNERAYWLYDVHEDGSICTDSATEFSRTASTRN